MSTSVTESKASKPEPGHPTPAPRFLPMETIAVRLLVAPTTDRRQTFGVISNMSVTGCCVITNRGLPVGTQVELLMRSARRPDIVGITARVVWCAERLEPMKEIVGYLTGVAFQGEDNGPVAELLMSGLFQPVP